MMLPGCIETVEDLVKEYQEEEEDTMVGSAPASDPVLVLSAKPNLYVSRFAMIPPSPRKGEAVKVRVSVYNNGDAPAGPYRVEWYAGENFPQPACTWNVSGTKARGGRSLTCTYSGYRSGYAEIRSKLVLDATGRVDEGDETDNIRLTAVKVVN